MATGLDGRWHAGIGDPSVVGWVTVGAYAVATVFAARAAVAAAGTGVAQPFQQRRLVLFWGLAAFILLLLGINKQLDLQSWFTEVVRDLSKQQGWYDDRRRYQVLFVTSLAGVGTVVTLAGMIALRRLLPRIGLALVGLGLLATFVVARAASFHHIDRILVSAPVPLNWTAELGSLVLIALNAWMASRAPPIPGVPRRIQSP